MLLKTESFDSFAQRVQLARQQREFLLEIIALDECCGQVVTPFFSYFVWQYGDVFAFAFGVDLNVS